MESLSTLIALVPAPPGAAIYRRDQTNDRAAIARADGVAERIELRDARALFESGDVLVAHSAFVAGRLGSRANVMLFDVLELFDFVPPGLPFVPSALGLARPLGLAIPHTPEQCAASLHAITASLLEEVAHWPEDARSSLAPLVGTLDRPGCRWPPLVKLLEVED